MDGFWGLYVFRNSFVQFCFNVNITHTNATSRIRVVHIRGTIVLDDTVFFPVQYSADDQVKMEVDQLQRFE
jgi:hypothetical protein